MNAREASCASEKQALIARCATQRAELQLQARGLGHTAALQRGAARGFSIKRIAFHVILATAGARRFGAVMALASQLLLLARLAASLRKAARGRKAAAEVAAR